MKEIKENLLNIKNQLFDAPENVKSSFDEVVDYFDASPRVGAKDGIIDTDKFHDLVPQSATKIVFSNESKLSKGTKVGTIDSKDLIEVWNSGTEYTIINRKGGKIFAPKDCTKMFYEYDNLTTLDLNNFNTSKVVNMHHMFSCRKLSSLDLSKFDTSKVTDMSLMFNGCFDIMNLDVSNFNTSKVKNMEAMFLCCSELTRIDVSKFDTSKVTNMCQMFEFCAFEELDLSNFNTKKVTDMHRMFFKCYDLESLNVNNFDTSKVTNMESMFNTCKSLTSLDLSSFNTKNVTDMRYMFMNCFKLTDLKLGDKFMIQGKSKDIDFPCKPEIQKLIKEHKK